MRTHQRNALNVGLLLGALALFACHRVTGQESEPAAQVVGARIVEAACGQCQFELAGDGCDLAVRVDGRAYFVDGTSIDDHGDAHAADGFCNAVRNARASGAVVGERFQSTAFELVAE